METVTKRSWPTAARFRRLLVIAVGAVAAGCGADGDDGEWPAGRGVPGGEAEPLGVAPVPVIQSGPATPVQVPGGASGPGAGAGEQSAGDVMPGGAAAGEAGGAAGELDELATRRVPAGTRIRATVDYEISTDLYRPGDAVVATVAEDVTDPSEDVLIPRGVKLLGRILTSAGSPGVGEPPVLEMTFETLSALNAEWPVEGAVINVPVVVDSRADIARRFQRNRSQDREVPGRVLEGAVVVVELRAGVRVGPVVGPEEFPWDSLPGWDTLPGADTLPRVDTLPSADAVPPGGPAVRGAPAQRGRAF